VNPDPDPIIEYALKPFVGNVWIAVANVLSP